MVLLYDLIIKNMDTKTKINTIISIVLVGLITALAYWAQIPSKDLKAELISTNTVLVRIQDFAFDPDVVRIEPETTVSWLHDESEGNADVQHSVSSYDPADSSAKGAQFESSLMSLGDTFSFTFNEPGVYNYNCSLYPFMTGKVCVGEESETLDSDCAIDMAVAPDAVVDEETLDEEEENILPDEEEAVEEETVVPEEVSEDTETDIVEDFDDDTDLLPAADEDFDTSVIDYSNDSAVVTTTTTTTTTSVQGTDLADSGPAEVVYLIAAMFALFMGRRLARNQA